MIKGKVIIDLNKCSKKSVGGIYTGKAGRPKGCKLLNKVDRSNSNQTRFGHRSITTSSNKEKDTPIKHGFHTEDYNRQCVYLHYYNNEDKPFYVGQGSIGRAFDFTAKNRNDNYNSKVEDVNLVKVEIYAVDVTPEKGVELEKELIAKYRFIKDGGSLVNIEIGGRGGSRGKYSNNKLSKPILQIDAYGNVVKKWASASEAHDLGGFDSSSIIKCCKHLPKYNSHKGYRWEYACD